MIQTPAPTTISPIVLPQPLVPIPAVNEVKAQEVAINAEVKAFHELMCKEVNHAAEKHVLAQIKMEYIHELSKKTLPVFEDLIRTKYASNPEEGLRHWKQLQQECDDDYDGPDPEITDFVSGITSYDALLNKRIAEPSQLLQGVLYKGDMMSLNASSKAGKTKLLIQLGLCVSAGVPWLGIPTQQGKVLYVNFELSEYVMSARLKTIKDHVLPNVPMDNFYVRNMKTSKLRGKRLIAALPRLAQSLKSTHYDMIIIDPIYQLYGHDVDENSAGDIHNVLQLLETVAMETGASVIYAHHHSKGSQGKKASIDRSSGSGVFGRYNDAIIDVTELNDADEDCESFVMSFNLRAFPRKKKLGIRIKGLQISLDHNLNLGDVKTGGQSKVKYTEKDLLNHIFERPYSTSELSRLVQADTGMSESTFNRLLKQVKAKEGVTQNEQDEWLYNIPDRKSNLK